MKRIMLMLVVALFAIQPAQPMRAAVPMLEEPSVGMPREDVFVELTDEEQLEELVVSAQDEIELEGQEDIVNFRMDKADRAVVVEVKDPVSLGQMRQDLDEDPEMLQLFKEAYIIGFLGFGSRETQMLVEQMVQAGYDFLVIIKGEPEQLPVKFRYSPDELTIALEE